MLEKSIEKCKCFFFLTFQHCVHHASLGKTPLLGKKFIYSHNSNDIDILDYAFFININVQPALKSGPFKEVTTQPKKQNLRKGQGYCGLFRQRCQPMHLGMECWDQYEMTQGTGLDGGLNCRENNGNRWAMKQNPRWLAYIWGLYYPGIWGL